MNKIDEILNQYIKVTTGPGREEGEIKVTETMSKEDVVKAMKEYAAWVAAQVLYTDDQEYRYLSIYNGVLSVYQIEIDEMIEAGE